MALRDLRASIAPAQSLSPRAVTAAVNGAGVDLRGYDSAVVLIDLGTITGTTPTATLKIQESDDNSAFTDVAAADLQGGALPGNGVIDTTNDDQLVERGYMGAKRYVRVICSAVSGTSPSLPMSGSVVRGHPHIRPA